MSKSDQNTSITQKLSEVAKAINKVYGKNTILPASQALALTIDRLPTGFFSLNLVSGGGYPRSRITMLKGGFSTGKTAACLKATSIAQRTCRYCNVQYEEILPWGEVIEKDCSCGKRDPYRCIWIDVEHVFDIEWAKKFNVDPNELMIVQTEVMEQAIDIADLAIRSKECDLLVVDSIAAMTPGIEIEKSSQDQQMGIAARLMSKATRKWTSGLNSYGLLGETKCTILLVNQTRMKIGPYAGIASPHGTALDFYESLEVRFKRASVIEEPSTKRPIGIEVEAVIKKNKTAPPSIPGCKFAIYFVPDPGVYNIGSTDTDLQVLDYAIYWELVEKNGAFYTINGEKHRGKARASKVLRENPELLSNLMEQIKSREFMWMTTGTPPSSKLEEDAAAGEDDDYVPPKDVDQDSFS